ncbi:MAG: efflux RND transporter periplasmic adaptor subunit [Desulfovibrio sp.]
MHSRYFQYTSLTLFLMSAALLCGCGSDIPAKNPLSVTPPPTNTLQVTSYSVPQWYDAVGTIEAKTGSDIEAQITAKIKQVHVKPGDKVKAGQLLIELDPRQAEAGLEQSKQQLESIMSTAKQIGENSKAAQAALTKRKSTVLRMRELFSQQVITQEELEKAETDFTAAKANYAASLNGLNSASSQIKEAEERYKQASINLEYTKIVALEDGKVAQRFADDGDLAFPGKSLLTLHTSGTLQLTAMVREGLIRSIKIGDKLVAVIDALDKSVTTVVDEIQPLADPTTRSFRIKTNLPILADSYPGMFARLRVPEQTKQIILIPESSIITTGQLKTVSLKTNSGWITQFIRTGETIDNGTRWVEIVSGLNKGDLINGEAN